MILEELRHIVCEANIALPRYNLVAWTSGNVSGRDPDTGFIVIKPSGILFEDLTPDKMVVVDSEARVIDGELGPSSDTASHVYVYNHRPELFGIVHTHSNYATAFAAVGKSIPVYLTAIADEFGMAIPCAPYARIGGQQIGKTILEHIGDCKAILMKQHGVFTVGDSVKSALKAAVMVEDAARTVWLAMQIGTCEELPADEININFERYQTRYGTMDASINE